MKTLRNVTHQPTARRIRVSALVLSAALFAYQTSSAEVMEIAAQHSTYVAADQDNERMTVTGPAPVALIASTASLRSVTVTGLTDLTTDDTNISIPHAAPVTTPLFVTLVPTSKQQIATITDERPFPLMAARQTWLSQVDGNTAPVFASNGFEMIDPGNADVYLGAGYQSSYSLDGREAGRTFYTVRFNWSPDAISPKAPLNTLPTQPTQ